MVKHNPLSRLCLPTGRSPETPGETALALALVRHSAARSQLGQAVERERKATAELWESLKRIGRPDDARAEVAFVTWNRAVALKNAAAAEVRKADAEIANAWRAWAAESASGWSKGEASHG